MIDRHLWTWLYDDYHRGTVFITERGDPSQRAIAEGLTMEQASSVVEAHNALVALKWRPLRQPNKDPGPIPGEPETEWKYGARLFVVMLAAIIAVMGLFRLMGWL